MSFKTLVALIGVIFIGAFVLTRLRQRTALAVNGSPTLEMRRQILSRTMLTDVTPGTPGVIRCVLMDWNVDGSNVATLVAFDDGTTSIYYSTGGGIIGTGTHENVKKAARIFRDRAATHTSHLVPTEQFDFPEADHIVFYMVYDTVTKTSGPIVTESIKNGTHPLAELGNSAQELIKQISLVNQGA